MDEFYQFTNFNLFHCVCVAERANDATEDRQQPVRQRFPRERTAAHQEAPARGRVDGAGRRRQRLDGGVGQRREEGQARQCGQPFDVVAGVVAQPQRRRLENVRPAAGGSDPGAGANPQRHQLLHRPIGRRVGVAGVASFAVRRDDGVLFVVVVVVVQRHLAFVAAAALGSASGGGRASGDASVPFTAALAAAPTAAVVSCSRRSALPSGAPSAPLCSSASPSPPPAQPPSPLVASQPSLNRFYFLFVVASPRHVILVENCIFVYSSTSQLEREREKER